MKIIITVHTYWPHNNGVQFVTQYLAEGLVKKGHEVLVITNLKQQENLSENEAINGVNVRRVKAYTKHTIHYGDKEKYVQEILRLSSRYDCMINVCTQCALTDWILPYLKQIKIPKILYLHSIWDFKYSKENFKDFKSIAGKIWANNRWKIYYNENASNFREYDIVTQLHKMDYTNKYFQKKYGIESKVIENAADDVFFEEKDKKIDIKLPKNYIINVSNYMERKNQLKAIELFYKLNVSEEWELILIGSDKNSYYNLLKRKLKEYDVKYNRNRKIQLLHNISRELIPYYVKNAKIYLMTSKWEAFPISIIESMAAKVPFVSSDVGIVKYLPGGVSCSTEDEYIYWLEQFVVDEKKREGYGKMGFQEASEKYKIEKKVEELEKIILEVKEKYEKEI